MPKLTEKVNKKVAVLKNKLQEGKIYNEFLEMAKGKFSFSTSQKERHVVSIYNGMYSNNKNTFMPCDFDF
jgi:hypothetical protein